jgi:hypothetical protein
MRLIWRPVDKFAASYPKVGRLAEYVDAKAFFELAAANWENGG